VRPDDAPLIQLLQQEQVRIIACPDAARGMGSSLACGVRALPAARAWLIALGDMPAVPAQMVADLAQYLRANGGIVAPSHKGRRGHPVGFSRTFFAELSQLDGDAGARRVIAAHEDQLALLPCADAGILCDIDRPEDLASAASAD
jgi:molybdenum cofactor cytidylyltransferase